MRKYFRLPDVPPFTQVRIDTDPNVDSPADIRTTDGLRVIPDSLLRADRTGDMPDVYGPDGATRLYLKAVSENVELDSGQADVPDLAASQTTGSLAGAAGPGLAYHDGQLLVAISADAGNSVELGTDHGLYVPAVVVDSNGNTVGTQGPIGPQGPQGLKGDKGDKGDPGVAGAAGAAGAVGPQGLIGATGPAGAAGPQGIKGDTGLTGPAGANGAQGPQGLAGVDGTVGAQGPQGIQGLTGATGLTGPIGPQGIQGLTGATGAAGPTGATGAAGPQGIQGIKGDTGDVGPVGPTGATGAKGDAGATGPAGTSADVLTTVTAALGQSLKYTSSKYDIALSADSGNAAAIGTDGGLLVPASNAGVGATGATGAKGDPGAAGPAGAAGAKGDKGDKGDPGNDGAPGAMGPAGTAGATGPTGPAGTTGATGLQGTQGDPGPAGATGPTGPQGSQGIKGDAGDPGPAGATGPQGSIGATGAKGDPGNAGPKGDTGTQGIQGLTGATGPAGTQGIKGDTGVAGPAGATGPQGIQGLTGATGAAGPAGSTGPAGATGTAGATGPQGAKGDTGSTGSPGAAATIGIGSVNTLTPGSSATVTNAGTSAAAVFNFGLPQGPTGATGPQGGVGAMGPAGPTGPQGPAGQGGITTAGTGINITGTGAAGSPYVVSATASGNAASTYLTSTPNQITVSGSGTLGDPYRLYLANTRGYVNAGTNVTVAGSGTGVDPYVVSAQTYIQGAGALQVVGSGSSNDPYVVYNNPEPEVVYGGFGITVTSNIFDGSNTVTAGFGLVVTNGSDTVWAQGGFGVAVNGSVVLDGSETKLVSGTNTTVTGSGTQSSPFKVNVTPPLVSSNATWTVPVDTANPGLYYQIPGGPVSSGSLQTGVTVFTPFAVSTRAQLTAVYFPSNSGSTTGAGNFTAGLFTYNPITATMTQVRELVVMTGALFSGTYLQLISGGMTSTPTLAATTNYYIGISAGFAFNTSIRLQAGLGTSVTPTTVANALATPNTYGLGNLNGYYAAANYAGGSFPATIAPIQPNTVYNMPMFGLVLTAV